MRIGATSPPQYRLRFIRVLLGGALILGGCSTPPEPTVDTIAPPASAAEADPNDLLPGPREVFGIRMPAGMNVTLDRDDRFAFLIEAPPERVLRYLKERAQIGTTEVGPQATTLEHVVPAGKPDSDAIRRITIERRTFSCRVLVDR